jgi:hypothetical protein
LVWNGGRLSNHGRNTKRLKKLNESQTQQNQRNPHTIIKLMSLLKATGDKWLMSQRGVAIWKTAFLAERALNPE